MDTQDVLQRLPTPAAFSARGMTKIDCFRSERLLVGVNCFEHGQAQPVHAHAGADKVYLVVGGKASFAVDARVVEAGAGDLVLPRGRGRGADVMVAANEALAAARRLSHDRP